jgi:hypothetical protein
MRYEGASKRAKIERFHIFLDEAFVRKTIQATPIAIAVAETAEITPNRNECQIDRRKYGSAAALKLEKVNHCGPWSNSFGLKATAKKRIIGRTRMLIMMSQKAVMGENLERKRERARGIAPSSPLALDIFIFA